MLASDAIKLFTVSERANQLILEQIDPALWTATPPGKVRPIAAIFTHMHNMRTKWIRLTAPHLKVPSQLQRAHCTLAQARKALAESARRCNQMLAEAFDGDGRITKFVRDGWGSPWSVGPEMLCYMVAHEAHHRGQICMLAHQLGHPLPVQVSAGLWDWEKLWRARMLPQIAIARGKSGDRKSTLQNRSRQARSAPRRRSPGR